MIFKQWILWASSESFKLYYVPDFFPSSRLALIGFHYARSFLINARINENKNEIIYHRFLRLDLFYFIVNGNFNFHVTLNKFYLKHIWKSANYIKRLFKYILKAY